MRPVVPAAQVTLGDILIALDNHVFKMQSKKHCTTSLFFVNQCGDLILKNLSCFPAAIRGRVYRFALVFNWTRVNDSVKEK